MKPPVTPNQMYVTGDLHGGDTSYHITSKQFYPAKRDDLVLCCGDLGGVWYHDYHTNQKHRKNEDYFLESRLRQHVTWLAVDGNHENFARLFGGEFPLVELYGGRAYLIRPNVYYLKRGDVFTIGGQTFLAFGGASSHDKDGDMVSSAGWGGGYSHRPSRKEGVDWWAEEVPSEADFENACRNLETVGWAVDYVITHTCPISQRQHFLSTERVPDPTEDMLQRIYERVSFREWHFGHFHTDKQVDGFTCHYKKVVPL